jgi:plastocyanin
LSLIAIVGGTSPQPSKRQNEVAVEVSNFQFNPAHITINQGDFVRWNRLGMEACWFRKELIFFKDGSHTTTSDPGQADNWNAALDASNPTFSKQFMFAGTFTFHCFPHQGLGMVGTVTVLPFTDVIVEVRSFEFSPAALAVFQGDVVRWSRTGKSTRVPR